MQSKCARKCFFSNWCLTLRNSHSPELHWAGLHSQTAKSITTKGFPGWKKSPGNVRTLSSFTNPLQPIRAGRGWQSDPLWGIPAAALNGTVGQVAETHRVPLKLPHRGAERAPWAGPCPLHGSAAGTARWGCNVACTGLSKGCCSDLMGLGLWFCRGALAAKLSVAGDVTETRGCERGAEPWGGRGSAAKEHQ